MASGSPNNGSVSGSAGTTLRTLARRLNWRGLGPSMVREDRVTMARTFTYLFGTGATLVLLSLLFPHSPARDTAGLLITTLGAYLVAVGFLVAWDRLPLWAFEASPLAGTVVVEPRGLLQRARGRDRVRAVLPLGCSGGLLLPATAGRRSPTSASLRRRTRSSSS